MTRLKTLVVGFAVLAAVGFADTNEASAAYSTYCGGGTKIWYANSIGYKVVFRETGTPSGGFIPRIYDVYRASQMTGWIYIGTEAHQCPF